MIHYLYKITNNLNGKYYIGVHSTENINDGYMGSGTGIIAAIEEQGVENFTKEILEYCDSREELMDREAAIVTADLVKDPNCYNRLLGGYGWRKRIFTKEEQRAKNREYYYEHREKLDELRRLYEKEHKEERQAKYKAYYESHRDERLEWQKKYYQEHKEERQEYAKKHAPLYNKEHKEEKTAYMHEYRNKNRERIREYNRENDKTEKRRTYRREYAKKLRAKKRL